MSTILSWIAAIFAFGLLIAFHEFGHMWVALRMGMRVERFSIGFGPVVWSFEYRGIEFLLSAIPLGGYVKVAGMGPDEEIEPDDEGAYANKPAWRRFLVIGAGPFANYLLAFCIGVPLLMTAARTDWDFSSPTVGAVAEESPAQKAGLREGDTILEIGGAAIASFDDLRAAVRDQSTKTPDAALPFVVEREGRQIPLEITPTKSAAGNPVIGVSPPRKQLPSLTFTEAVPAELSRMWALSVESLRNFGKLFTREASPSDFSGPAGMLKGTAERASQGLVPLLEVVWFLSVAIGFFNLLPVPGLDGGRLAFLGYEVLARRRVNARVEMGIHLAGLAAVLLLVVLATVGDFRRMFGG